MLLLASSLLGSTEFSFGMKTYFVWIAQCTSDRSGSKSFISKLSICLGVRGKLSYNQQRLHLCMSVFQCFCLYHICR